MDRLKTAATSQVRIGLDPLSTSQSLLFFEQLIFRSFQFSGFQLARELTGANFPRNLTDRLLRK